MPTAKTPEIVMKEFDERWHKRALTITDTESLRPWLRSAMQSLLQQAVVELEEKRDSVSWMETKKDMEILERVTIGDCITVIKSLSE